MYAVDTTDNPTTSVGETVNDIVHELIASVVEEAPDAPTAPPRTAAPTTTAPTQRPGTRWPSRHLSEGRQYARFLMVGVSNAVVDLAVLNALLWANPTRN